MQSAADGVDCVHEEALIFFSFEFFFLIQLEEFISLKKKRNNKSLEFIVFFKKNTLIALYRCSRRMSHHPPVTLFFRHDIFLYFFSC